MDAFFLRHTETVDSLLLHDKEIGVTASKIDGVVHLCVCIIYIVGIKLVWQEVRQFFVYNVQQLDMHISPYYSHQVALFTGLYDVPYKSFPSVVDLSPPPPPSSAPFVTLGGGYVFLR